jgi:hypothetical protein
LDLKKAEKYIGTKVDNRITELPKLYFYRDGIFFEYNLEWKVDIFTPFLAKMNAARSVLGSVEEVKTFYNSHGLRVIGLFHDDDRDADSEYAKFNKACYTMATWSTAHTAEVTDTSVIQALKAEGELIQTLDNILIKRADGSTDKLELASNQDGNIWLWILSHSLMITDEYKPENYKVYEAMRKPIFLMFLDAGTVEADFHFKMFKAISENFDEERVKFAWVDVSSGD